MIHSIITSFTGKYRFLSNFYPVDINYESITYPSVENAYQAAKTTDILQRIPFQTMSAAQAKRAGKILDIRPDWDEVKKSIMFTLVYNKFKFHPKLGKMLLDTGNSMLVEGNTWGDTYWGICNGKGFNHLGDILMKIRNHLRD